MKEKIIPITFSVDDNYVKHAATVMVSILSNSDSSYTYEFIVFDNGIKRGNEGTSAKGYFQIRQRTGEIYRHPRQDGGFSDDKH